MFTSDDLLELHRRTQTSVQKAIDHCEGFAPEALHVEHAGFGYPTVLRQLHHVAGAERYWVGVILGRMQVDDDGDLFPTAESLQQLRLDVFRVTNEYLRGASEGELNTPRTMRTDPGDDRILMPARVILRTTTHLHHHIGQVAAMCRLLGHPIPGFNFPII